MEALVKPSPTGDLATLCPGTLSSGQGGELAVNYLGSPWLQSLLWDLVLQQFSPIQGHWL